MTSLTTPVRAASAKEMSLERAELLQRTQVQVRGNDAARAATALHLWTVDHPRDLGAWRALGAAYEVQGRAVAAIRAQAQADGLQQDWTSALGRLRAAQDLVRKGQGVLNIIALGPVVEEIDAQIVALAPATQAEHLSRTRTARAAGDGRAAR
jgi:predicted Zn-dependent protease